MPAVFSAFSNISTPDMQTPGSTQNRPEGPGARSRLDDLQEAFFRARVLLSSYAALNFILVARLSHWGTLRWICLGLGVLGVVDALRLTLLAKTRGGDEKVFVEVRDSGSEIAGYLATYLLPLLAAPNPDMGEIVGYAIYGLLIIVITLRSDLAHVNPTLYALGWKIVSVRTSAGHEQFLVCRTAPRPGHPVYVTDMNGLLHEARPR
jgi:hypothetical protein